MIIGSAFLRERAEEWYGDIPPERHIQLTVLGFPKGLGAEGRFSPLSLQTLPASGILTLPGFDNGKKATFFILQNPAMGGYSGAPVIDVSLYQFGAVSTTGGGTRLFGLVHGTLSDDTGGKLAAVVPSAFIIEAIQQAQQN